MPHLSHLNMMALISYNPHNLYHNQPQLKVATFDSYLNFVA